MTTFDERERSFEKKFALDEEFKFKAVARRNRLIGEWAAAKLGMSSAAAEDYIKAVRKIDLAAKSDSELLEKVRKDLGDKGIDISQAELRQTFNAFMKQAVAQITRQGETA
jgi:hypothetical protein